MSSLEGDTLNSHGLSEFLNLLQILSNPLILYHTIQYLPVSSLLALGAASKSFQGIIHRTPNIFRYLDLSRVKSVQFGISKIDNGGEVWRNVQLDENVTEDDFYGGPLRGVFGELRRRHILENVQILVLDGLSVTSELLFDVIIDPSFNVRLLSVREVQNLNERKLMQALEYSVRPTRPVSKPKLHGLYIFGKKDSIGSFASGSQLIKPAPTQSFLSPGGVTTSQGAQLGAQLNQRSRDELLSSMQGDDDELYGPLGTLFSKPPLSDWARTLEICKGLISFDGILCSGPRHDWSALDRADISQVPWYSKPAAHLAPAIATVALKGCSSCHKAPEGIVSYGITPPHDLPLLAPPPFQSSTIKAATRSTMTIKGKNARLLQRCRECLKDRYCESCYKWWCEDCYELLVGNLGMKPPHMVISGITDAGNSGGSGPENFKLGAWRDCPACGFMCAECITRTQHRCKVCGGGYCLIHNEGSTITTCDCVIPFPLRGSLRWYILLTHELLGCLISGRRTRELY